MEANRNETRTLAGKVRYILPGFRKKHMRDPTPQEATRWVWWHFYYEVVRPDPARLGYFITDIAMAVWLPSVREVRAAMRRISRARPRDAPPTPKPYNDD